MVLQHFYASKDNPTNIESREDTNCQELFDILDLSEIGLDQYFSQARCLVRLNPSMMRLLCLGWLPTTWIISAHHLL